MTPAVFLETVHVNVAFGAAPAAFLVRSGRDAFLKFFALVEEWKTACQVSFGRHVWDFQMMSVRKRFLDQKLGAFFEHQIASRIVSVHFPRVTHFARLGEFRCPQNSFVIWDLITT